MPSVSQMVQIKEFLKIKEQVIISVAHENK